MAKTPNEVRLEIHEMLTEMLVSLAVDDDTTDEEVADFENDFAQVATLVLDTFGFEVTSVSEDEDGTTRLTANLSYEEGEPLDDEDLDGLDG
jgi:hypothetical protein